MDDMYDRDDIDDSFDSPQAVRKMRLRHAKLGLAMQALAAKGLAELERKVASGEVTLSVEDALALLDAGAKIKSAALGEPPTDDAPTPEPKKPN